MKKSISLTISIFLSFILASCGGLGDASFESLPTSSDISSSEEVTSSEDVSSEVIHSSEKTSSKEVSSESSSLPELDHLKINRVNNITDNFIKGMDISSVIALEQSGVKYYNRYGQKEDLFKILADNGVNYIRVRVWNDPYDSNGKGYGGGNNDVAKAITIGKRATQNGMKLLVDFHYSDFWADPQKQTVPKAWKDMTFDAKNTALYQFTKDTLNTLKSNQIDIGMVAVGNEITNSFCGELRSRNNYFTLLSSGSKAVREVLPNAKVAVHYTNPNRGYTESFASGLKNHNVDYDVFGYSYYPHYHGTFENLITQFNVIADNYNKECMIMETSYGFTTEDTDFFGNTYYNSASQTKFGYEISPKGQASIYRDLCDLMVNDVHNNKGIGVCYWEGAWITVGGKSWNENHTIWEKYGSGWASSYAAEYDKDVAEYGGNGTNVDNQVFFDSKGKATAAIEVFNLVNNGEAEPVEEGVVIYRNNTKIDVENTKSSTDTAKGKYVITLAEGDKLKFKDSGVDLHFYRYNESTQANEDLGIEYTITKNGEHTIWYDADGKLWVDEPEASDLVVYLTGSAINGKTISWTFKDDLKFSVSSRSGYKFELLNVSLASGAKVKAGTSSWSYEWSYSKLTVGGSAKTQAIEGTGASNFKNANDNHDNIQVITAGTYNFYISDSDVLTIDLAS